MYANGEDAREACTATGSNSGGGGGAAGVIRLNSRGADADLQTGAIISPSDELGVCTGLCSQEEVTVR